MAEMETQISRALRSNPEATEAYDRISRLYDVLAGSSEQESVRLGLEELAAVNGGADARLDAGGDGELDAQDAAFGHPLLDAQGGDLS